MYYGHSRSPASIAEGRSYNSYGKGISLNYSTDLALSSLSSRNPSIQRIVNSDFGFPERSRSPLRDYSSSGSRLSGLRSMHSSLSGDTSPIVRRRDLPLSHERSSPFSLLSEDLSYSPKSRNYFDYSGVTSSLFTSYTSPIKCIKKPQRIDYSDYLRPAMTARPMLKTGYVPRSREERDDNSEPIVRERKLIKFRETSDHVLTKIGRKMSWDLPEETSSHLIDEMKEMNSETGEEKSMSAQIRSRENSSSRRGSKDFISCTHVSDSPRPSLSRRSSGDQSLDRLSGIRRKSSRSNSFIEDSINCVQSKVPIPPLRKKSIGPSHKIEKPRKSTVDMLLSDDKTSNFSKIANEIRRSRGSEASRMITETLNETQRSSLQDAFMNTGTVEARLQSNAIELTSIKESAELDHERGRRRRRRDPIPEPEETPSETRVRCRSRFRSQTPVENSNQSTDAISNKLFESTSSNETSHPTNRMHRKSVKYKSDCLLTRRSSKSSDVILEPCVTPDEPASKTMPAPASTKDPKQCNILTTNASNKNVSDFNKVGSKDKISKTGAKQKQIAQKNIENECKLTSDSETQKFKLGKKSILSQSSTSSKQPEMSENVRYSDGKTAKPESMIVDNSSKSLTEAKKSDCTRSFTGIANIGSNEKDEKSTVSISKIESKDSKLKPFGKNYKIENKEEDVKNSYIEADLKVEDQTECKHSSNKKILRSGIKSSDENSPSKKCLIPEKEDSKFLLDKVSTETGVSNVNSFTTEKSNVEAKYNSKSSSDNFKVETKLPTQAISLSNTSSKIEIKGNNKLLDEKSELEPKTLDEKLSINKEDSTIKTKDVVSEISTGEKTTKQKLSLVKQSGDNQTFKTERKNEISKPPITINKASTNYTEKAEVKKIASAPKIEEKSVQSKELEEIVVICKLPPPKKNEPIVAKQSDICDQKVIVSIKNSALKSVDSRENESVKNVPKGHAIIPTKQSISNLKLETCDSVKTEKYCNTEDLDVKVSHTIVLKPKVKREPANKVLNNLQKTEKEICAHDKLKPIPDVIKSTVRINTNTDYNISDIVKSTLAKGENQEKSKKCLPEIKNVRVVEKCDESILSEFKAPITEVVKSDSDRKIETLAKDKIDLKGKDKPLSAPREAGDKKLTKLSATVSAVSESGERLHGKSWVQPDLIQVAAEATEIVLPNSLPGKPLDDKVFKTEKDNSLPDAHGSKSNSESNKLLLVNNLNEKAKLDITKTQKIGNVEEKLKETVKKCATIENKTTLDSQNESQALKTLENQERNIKLKTGWDKAKSVEKVHDTDSINNEKITDSENKDMETKPIQNLNTKSITDKAIKSKIETNEIPRNKSIPDENISKYENESKTLLLGSNLDENTKLSVSIREKSNSSLDKTKETLETSPPNNTKAAVLCKIAPPPFKYPENKNQTLKKGTETDLNIHKGDSKNLLLCNNLNEKIKLDHVSNKIIIGIEENKLEETFQKSPPGESRNGVGNKSESMHLKGFENREQNIKLKAQSGNVKSEAKSPIGEISNERGTASVNTDILKAKTNVNRNSSSVTDKTTDSKMKISNDKLETHKNILPQIDGIRKGMNNKIDNLKNETNLIFNQTEKTKSPTTAYKKSTTVPDVGSLLKEQNLTQKTNETFSNVHKNKKIEPASLSAGNIPVTLQEGKPLLKVTNQNEKHNADLISVTKVVSDENSSNAVKLPGLGGTQKESNKLQFPKISSSQEKFVPSDSTCLKDINNKLSESDVSDYKIPDIDKINLSNSVKTPPESLGYFDKNKISATYVEISPEIKANEHKTGKKFEAKSKLLNLSDQSNLVIKTESIDNNDNSSQKSRDVLANILDISLGKTMPKFCDTNKIIDKVHDKQKLPENLKLPPVYDVTQTNPTAQSNGTGNQKDAKITSISDTHQITCVGNVIRKDSIPVLPPAINIESKANDILGNEKLKEVCHSIQKDISEEKVTTPASNKNLLINTEIHSNSETQILSKDEKPELKQTVHLQQKQTLNEEKVTKTSEPKLNKPKEQKLPPVPAPYGRFGLFLRPKEPPTTILESSSSEESETESESSDEETAPDVNKNSELPNGKSPDRDEKGRSRSETSNASIYSNLSNSTTCTTFSTSSLDEEYASPIKPKAKIKQLRFRKYEIDDFVFLKLLGKGSFGKVLLAELKDSEMYFAIKCLKKDVVLEDDDVESTMIERRVLALGTQHPYMCKLYCTFQTKSYLYFVMEYLNGGDLMFHIQDSRRFEEKRAVFYGAEIVSALKFLHKRGIVYRDIKLDNIILDKEGHVHLVDFGMCKTGMSENKRASTFCGTPDYIPPEIVMGQTYNQSVDWWSFGVLLYEMLTGRSPFHGTDEDELFWSICNEEPHFPRFLSKEAIHILGLLLLKAPSKRLGMPSCPAGDIKDHAFFSTINWDKIEKKQVPPAFKPSVSSPSDTSNFDSSFTMDTATLSPVDNEVLESMDQQQFHGFSYTNPHITD